MVNEYGSAAYMYARKITELLTIILLFRLMPVEEFNLGFFTLVIAYTLMDLFSVTYQDKDVDKVKRFYNMLSAIGPLMGLVVAAIFMALSGINPLLRLAAVLFVLYGIALPPLSYFRTKQYRTYKLYFIAQICMTVTSLVLVYLGYDSRAVLFGVIVYYLVALLMLWQTFPMTVTPTIDKEMLSQYLRSLRSSALSTFIAYGPLLAGGLFLDQFHGLFLAYLIGFFLYENLTVFINYHILPYFLELEGNTEQFTYNIVRYFEYVAFLVTPLSSVVIVLAPQISTFLIEANVADSITLLAIAGMLKGIFFTSRVILLSFHKVRQIQYINLIEGGTLALFIAVLIGSGIQGIAVAVLMSSIVSSLLYLVYASRLLKLDLLVVSKDLFYIIVAGLLTMLVLGFIKELFYIGSLAALSFVVLAGFIFYAGTVYVFNKDLYKRFIRFIFNIIEE